MNYKRFEDLPCGTQQSAWPSKSIPLPTQLISEDEEASEIKSNAPPFPSPTTLPKAERGTNNELLAFLYIARGSAGEVRSMLCCSNGFQLFSRSTRRLVRSRSEQRVVRDS